MKITDYVAALNLELKVRFGANQVGPWIASIYNRSGLTVDFKNSYDDCMSRSCTGWGQTPDLAIANLITNLKEHKYIVINQSKDDRLKLPLPDSLEML